MSKTPNLTDSTANNQKIIDSFINTVSRDGSTPNQMEADFDLNNNDLLNAKSVYTKSLIINGIQFSPNGDNKDTPATFSTINEMALDKNLTDRELVIVKEGYNGQPEWFVYSDTDTSTADGSLIVTATGMGVGRLISTRTHTTNLSTLLADPRNFASYTYRTTGEGYRYIVIPAADGPGSLQTAGGDWLRYTGNQGRYHLRALNPAANGVADDSDKIDLLNGANVFVDLGNKDYKYSGTFTPAATFTNGRIIDNNRTYDYRVSTRETHLTAGQSRGRLNYGSPDKIRVDGIPDALIMGGFRSVGNYLNSEGRKVPTGLSGKSHVLVSQANDQGVLNSGKTDNWYAVFAVANDTEPTCRFVLMPYLRCYSVSGNTITLASSKEGTVGSLQTVTYDIDDDALAGTACLLATENDVLSRRQLQISGNTSTTVTLDTAGLSPILGLAPGDFFLPEPPNVDQCHYLGTAYWEYSINAPGDWRNIADSGHEVQARLVNASDCPELGALSAHKVRLADHISPLATGVLFRYTAAIQTPSTGKLTENFWHDGNNHDVAQVPHSKHTTGTENMAGEIRVMFSKSPAVWLDTTGTLAGPSIPSFRKMLIRGWIEP